MWRTMCTGSVVLPVRVIQAWPSPLSHPTNSTAFCRLRISWRERSTRTPSHRNWEKVLNTTPQKRVAAEVLSAAQVRAEEVKEVSPREDQVNREDREERVIHGKKRVHPLCQPQPRWKHQTTKEYWRK